MGIVTLQPDKQPPSQTTTPDTIEAPSTSIFTSLVPESKITSLLKYVEGYPWTIDYYGQLINKGNTLENFDPTTPNLTQPYYKISKLILQVSSPLDSSYDSATGITTIRGSAITPYKVTPNVGDVFIAQVDTGEDAIFHITSVTRKTFKKDTLYEISYSLYSYTSTNPDFVKTLEERVNDKYYFNKDTNFFNRDVLIKPSVKEAIDRLSSFITESQNYYFHTFSQKQTGTILIPGIENKLYDPLLINFISKIVPYSILVDTPFYRHAYNSKYIDQPSILTALLDRTKSTLNFCNKTYSFLPTSLLPNSTRLGTIYHTGVDYILHPITPNTNTNLREETLFSRSEYINTMRTSRNYNNDTPIIVKTTNNNDIFNMFLLPELFIDDYYIVTKNFYDYLTDNTVYINLTYTELLIYRFLNGDAIAKEDLAVAVESYTSWSLLHQLYLLPIYWLLIKAN